MQTYSYNQLKNCEKEKVRILACRDIRVKKLKREQVLKKYNISSFSLKSWLSKYDQHGEVALKDQKLGRPKGSGNKLSKQQFNSLKKTITNKTPDKFKLPYFLWSREAIQQLIKIKFKVEYSVSHISCLMKELGFTIQKPKLKYAEQDDKAVKKWLETQYPQIVESAKSENAEIHWADETAVQNKANSERSYAPKGKTPIFVKSGKRFKTSIISSVTNQGKIRFMTFEKGLTSEKMIEFMERLIKRADRKIYLILDNLSVHKSIKVRKWEESYSERIKLFYLPSYSPDLNPDELVNGYLKKIVFKEKRPENREEIVNQARKAMRRIQNQPQKVKLLFEHPSVRYAKAG